MQSGCAECGSQGLSRNSFSMKFMTQLTSRMQQLDGEYGDLRRREVVVMTDPYEPQSAPGIATGREIRVSHESARINC